MFDYHVNYNLPFCLTDVCNLRNGFNLEPAVKLNFFFLGSPITVTSLPFGRPRLRITGGIEISIYDNVLISYHIECSVCVPFKDEHCDWLL